MFVLCAEKNKLTVRQREQVTSGSVNVYPVRFKFSPEWEGLSRTACFRSGAQVVSVLLDDSGECTVPWEVIDPGDKGKRLYAGVYGSRGSTVVLPTVWADLGVILEGVGLGANARPPAPDLWEQALESKGDGLAYDGLNLSLTAGDKPLSTVQIAGGEGGGVSDHRALAHRDAADQHPIAAVAGLERELSRRISSDDALSVIDIIKIMEG